MLQLGPDLFDLLNAKQNVGERKPVVYGKGGMSEAQLRDVQAQLGFPMPEDFIYLLKNVQDPGGVLFPWPAFKLEKYNESIEWVRHGIEFDIEQNAFWLGNRWGKKPAMLAESIEVFRKDFATWPKLLPIYGHRYLIAEPCQSGNPVLSIMQADIIYYGANLAHYLKQEFIPGEDHTANTYQIRTIDVWSSIANGEGESSWTPSVN